jgi:hypothetical protein
VAGARIDTLMLADWAEAIDGKLYVMGGGFTAVRLRDFDRPHRCSLAAILRVPPADAGRPIPLSAHLETAAGERLEGWSLGGELSTEPRLGQRDDEEGVAVLAGPVEVNVSGAARLVLRFSFGEDARDLPLDVLAM